MRNKMKVIIAMLISCICLTSGALFISAAGVLSIAVSSGSVAVGDNLTITVYANGADNSEVTADMKITYDASKLEYVSSSQSGASGGGGTVTVSGSTVDVKFKALGAGDTRIQAEGAAVTAAGTVVKVTGTTQEKEKDTALSGDNSLSSLSISPGTLSPSFKGNNTKYTAAVGSDVNEIKVNPVAANSKATVESVTGNKNLKDGDNKVSIVVKAENGTTATYTISVKKGGAPAQEPAKETPEDESTVDDTDNNTATSEGGITVNNTNYSISESFTKEEIPERFVESTIEYGGSSYKGIIFDKGEIGMLYLVSDAGDNKGFFIYDASKNTFYPFVQLKSGEHFIIPMMTPGGSIPPENYAEASLSLSEYGTVAAYQYAPKDNADKTEAVSDFYLFYAINDEGEMGWYQYDNVQQTYQRLNAENMASSSDDENYNTLLDAYNELSDRYNNTKTKDRRLITVLIFVCAVLAILVINLILRGRSDGDEGNDEDDEDDEDGGDGEEKENRRITKRARRESIHKEKIPIKRKPIEKKPIERAPMDEDAFFEGDDDEAFSDFEDEPGLLSRVSRKKIEKPKAEKSRADETRRNTVKDVKQVKTVQRQKEPEKASEDDDIEFLDLNDL